MDFKFTSSLNSLCNYVEVRERPVSSICRVYSDDLLVSRHSSCCLSEDNQDLFYLCPLQPVGVIAAIDGGSILQSNIKLALCISMQTPVE